MSNSNLHKEQNTNLKLITSNTMTHTKNKKKFKNKIAKKNNNVITAKTELDNKKILFDYRNNKTEYKNKCEPIICHMINNELINQLNTLTKKTMNNFLLKYNLDKNIFTHCDFEEVLISKPLIKSIAELSKCTDLNIDDLILETNSDINQLAKLIKKKYIIKKLPTNKKVRVNVIVGDVKEIKVISYNMSRNNKYCLNDPKGSIEQNELPIDALLRELTEELGFNFDAERYQLQMDCEKFIKYTLNITEEECFEHFKNLDTSKLDPEITHIVLQNIIHV